MAKKSSSIVQDQKDPQGFPAVLASAIYEWFLICFLFVNALFSYLVTKFARFCKLQPPCLLCSRLDHVVGNEKPGFYRDYLCSAHKMEISSLVFCPIHDKLADVQGMCEGCLFSFATEKKSNSETYRLLVGKLGGDLDGYRDSVVKKSSCKSRCSCCNDTWASRSYFHKLFQTKSMGAQIAEREASSPGSAGHSHARDSMKKRSRKQSGQKAWSYLRSRSFDPLSHIGYSELKITSESESEVPFSDEDDASALGHEADGIKEEFVAQSVQLEPHTTNLQTVLKTPHDVAEEEELIYRASIPTTIPHTVLITPHDVAEEEELTYQASIPTTIPKTVLKTPHDVAQEELIYQPSIPRPSFVVPCEQLDVGSPHEVTSSTSTVAVGHGLEELNWHQAEQQTEVPAPAPPEFISLKDLPLPAKTVDVFVGVSGKTIDTMETGDTDRPSMTEAGKVSKLESDLIMPTELCLKTSEVVEVSEKTCAFVAGTDDNGQTSVIERVEIHELESGEVHNLEGGLSTISGPCLKTDQVLNDAGAPITNLVDLTDAYILAIGNKGSQVSTMLSEQLTGKDSTRITEELKLLLSQVSAARGIELSSNDMSPRIHVNGEELKLSDASSSMGLHMLPKRISMERNESGSESLDGSIVSEIEGESVVDRLKRQVEYDWKSMSALYKELEEERNASAIAANQALAMITRLQEEKASLHMEALQYLRMMEEQAEYDVEALQKANDLLADKEKEMQDLEAELEDYRRKFSNELTDEDIQESWCDMNGRDMPMEHPDESCIGLNTNLPCNSVVSKESEGSNIYEKNDMVNGDNCMSAVKDSLLNFEDERIYISNCLKKLERQLTLVSSNGVHGDISHGVYSVKESHGVKHHHCDEATHGNGQLQEDEASEQKESSIEGPSTQESSSPSVGNCQLEKKENHHSDSDGQNSITDRDTPLVVIENEVSDLNERLDALEADRTFLEHSINALRSGDEGVKFLKDIAHHLRELRRIGIRRGDETVT